jgi:hypothetical protein
MNALDDNSLQLSAETQELYEIWDRLNELRTIYPHPIGDFGHPAQEYMRKMYSRGHFLSDVDSSSSIDTDPDSDSDSDPGPDTAGRLDKGKGVAAGERISKDQQLELDRQVALGMSGGDIEMSDGENGVGGSGGGVTGLRRPTSVFDVQLQGSN